MIHNIATMIVICFFVICIIVASYAIILDNGWYALGMGILITAIVIMLDIRR